MRIINALLSTGAMFIIMLPQALAAPPGGHLNITQVFVDDTSIMIIGEDLLFGPQGPTVTLGDFGTLTIVGTPTNALIEATLPALISAGDYLLMVSGGNGQSENDEYDLTISEDVAVLRDAVCNLQARLGGPLLDSCARKLVFSTSGIFQPRTGFRGLADADLICQNHADSASLPGTYKAWLSDSTESPSTRFAQSTDPYTLVNGTVVAANYNDLTDNTLFNPINITQTGAVASSFVWTGTRSNGTAFPNRNCRDWLVNSNSSSFAGQVGRSTDSGSAWSSALARRCNNFSRFYCFQQ